MIFDTSQDSPDSTEAPDESVVVADDPVGVTVTRRLDGVKKAVLVGSSGTVAGRLEKASSAVTRVDDVASFDYTAASEASSAIVATSSDSRNLLLAQKLRVGGIDDIVVRLNDPQSDGAFDSLPVDTVKVADVTGEELVKRLRTRDGETR